jgi:hypothetical protein
MNRIIFVADGRFDSKKIISALQKMILNPELETVKVLQGQNMEYTIEEGSYTREPIIGKRSFIMAQIVEKGKKSLPDVVSFRNSKGKKCEYWVSGILDREKVLDSGIINDFVTTKCAKQQVLENPDLILKYLVKEDRSIEEILREYNIEGIYSILDLDSKYPCFTTRSTLNTICYTSAGDGYICNCKDVFDYLCLKYSTNKRYNDVIQLYPYGRNYSCASIPKDDEIKEDMKKYITGRDKALEDFKKSQLLIVERDTNNRLIDMFNPVYEHQKLASKCLENHVYTFKNKNK